MWEARSIAQLLRSFYIFVFQLPALPELWLRSGDLGFVRGTLLGGSRGPGTLGARRRGERLCLDSRDAAAFAWSLSRAGSLTAGVNWYRCIFSHNVDTHAALGMEAHASLRAPTLLVWGDEDGALGGGDAAVAATAPFAAGEFAAAVIPRCSHWVMQDATLEALQAVAPFLGMRAPPGDAAAAAFAGAERSLRRSGAKPPALAQAAPAMHDVAAFQPLDED